MEHILKSTMAFFDTTPIGRIINRFSKDIDEVDFMIPAIIKSRFLNQDIMLKKNVSQVLHTYVETGLSWTRSECKK